MATVALPDGREVEFPDGMPMPQMEAAIHEFLGRPAPQAGGDGGPAQSPARFQKRAGTPEPWNVGTAIDNLGRSVATGATFNFMDEIAAGGDAALGHLVGRGSQAPTIGQRYDENLAAERARDEAIPGAIAVPGQIAGGVAAGVVAAPAAAYRAVLSAPTYVNQLGRLAGLGAAQGAVAGFGAGEDGVGNRLGSAAAGAAIGGVAGAVIPLGIDAVKNVGTGVRNALMPTNHARAEIGRAITRDGTTPQALQDAATDVSALRPGVAAVADVGGENVRGLVERVAQTPGAGRTMVVPTMMERQNAQLQRVADDLKAATGSDKTAFRAVEDTIASRSAAARPLYEEAMSVTVPPADYNRVSRFVRDPIGQDAMKRGLRVIEAEHLKDGTMFRPSDYGVTKQGAGEYRLDRGTPNMRLLDAVKLGYDEIVDGYRNDFGVLNLDKFGKAINDARFVYRDALAEMNPKYGEALRSWSDPSAYIGAIKNGRRIADQTMSAEELQSIFGRMTDAEKEGFRIGAVSSILGKMGNNPAKLADMTRSLRSPEMRAKIEAIIPDEAAAAQWRRLLDFEVGSSELTGRALSGSPTARRMAEQKEGGEVAGDLVRDALGAAITGNWWSALMRGLGNTPRALRDTVRSPSDKIIADMLVNPSKANELMQFLGPVNPTPRRTPTNRLAPAVIGGSAPALSDR